MNSPLFTASFPLLPKRPRLRHTTPRCSASKSDSVELTRKVEATLLDVEQAPPPPTPASPRPLPMQRQLLAYHARYLSRRPKTRATAEALYLRILDQDSADGRAWVGLGKVRLSDGRVDGARAALRQGARLCVRNAHILQFWGVLEERCDNKRRAHALYSAATRADPEHAPAWVALGLWHQRHARDAAAAAEAFGRGAAADPRNHYVWHVWGVLERERRRFAAARKCFERGVAANPRNGATLVVWGALEAQLGRTEVAMRIFRRAHHVSPRNAHAYVAHAAVAERTGDVIGARRLLSHARRVKPNDPAPLQSLGLLEMRAGEYEMARDRFREALALSSSHAPSWHSWACMERSLGDLVKARELFQQAVWAVPKRPHVVRTWHAWAALERDAGRTELARRYVAHGLRVDRRSPALLTMLAEIEAADGNVVRARELLEVAVRESPRERFVWRAYEQLERDAGAPERAAKIQQRMLVAGKMDGERLTVSAPMAGDFASSGMWIGADDLRDAETVGETAPVREERRERDSRGGQQRSLGRDGDWEGDGKR